MHHYYDGDFLKHLKQVNPELAQKLQDQKKSTIDERRRLDKEYRDALKKAFAENKEKVIPLMRPCHQRRVNDLHFDIVVQPWY